MYSSLLNDFRCMTTTNKAKLISSYRGGYYFFSPLRMFPPVTERIKKWVTHRTAVPRVHVKNDRIFFHRQQNVFPYTDFTIKSRVGL